MAHQSEKIRARRRIAAAEAVAAEAAVEAVLHRIVAVEVPRRAPIRRHHRQASIALARHSRVEVLAEVAQVEETRVADSFNI